MYMFLVWKEREVVERIDCGSLEMNEYFDEICKRAHVKDHFGGRDCRRSYPNFDY